ncbi:MAG: radical SAM protein [Bacteroidales bacterium]|nr:radical SAM protein [Bacteroidales bacterium]MBQ8811970.1 radical SAM protein [Bacteroidales bacterium]
MRKAPLIGINRLRLGTDGQGIRTLVAFHGCPLSCRYCLNPSCLSATAKVTYKPPEQIAKILQKDALYFLASRGGVTFGGGDPLLRSEFIREVIKVYGKEKDVAIETSLNVPRNDIEIVLPLVNELFVDVKDMDPRIYKDYTGQYNGIGLQIALTRNTKSYTVILRQNRFKHCQFLLRRAAKNNCLKSYD